MNDQALRLREIAGNSFPKTASQKNRKIKAKCIAVTSGKGGVGKSNIALNLAITLSKSGLKTLLLDADLNLGNLDILLGKSPEYNISSMFIDRLPVERVIHKAPEGLHVISGCSGNRELAGIENIFKDFIIDSLIKIESNYDYIIIDTAAGIDHYVIDFLIGADEVVVVVTGEPTSILDSYALIKVLTAKGIYGNINILVNQVSSLNEAREVFKKIGIAVKKFLSYRVKYLGYLPNDKKVINAVRTQTPFVILNPESNVSHIMRQISKGIVTDNDKKYIENEADCSYFTKLKSIILKRRVN